jgi:hypothetical protein
MRRYFFDVTNGDKQFVDDEGKNSRRPAGSRLRALRPHENSHKTARPFRHRSGGQISDVGGPRFLAKLSIPGRVAGQRCGP